MKERYIHTHCSYTEQYTPEGEHVYTFTGPCRVTGTPYSVKLHGHELWDLNQGKTVQSALSRLSTDDREFVVSGTSPKGWDILFAPSAILEEAWEEVLEEDE